MSHLTISRRKFLHSTAAGLVAAGSSSRLAHAAEVTIGIVYVGPRDDFGWNQAHAVAVKALKSLPGVKAVEEENVPETDACAKSMESMVNLDGANIILGTSFGYFDPFMVDLSKKYAKVEFRHAAPLWNESKHPKNLGSYFGYLNQAHHVDGVAAGLSTRSNKIGFVAAKPISIVLSNINSFMLGARNTNPNAVVQVIFTGDWSLPVREAEAVNALAAAGLRPQCVPGAARAKGLHHRRRVQVGDDLQRLRGGAGQGSKAAEYDERWLRRRYGAQYALRRRRVA